MREVSRSWQFPAPDEDIEELIRSFDQLSQIVGDEPLPGWWRRVWWWLQDFPGWWND